ncbi:ABC transporter permease [Rugosimonospora acidiphila]|uniref:ABC transporter permease n=1 Tax=Rugosimonospora acidiphila TaxID=556531 RepID=A0ABP9S1M0_9ACTN
MGTPKQSAGAVATGALPGGVPAGGAPGGRSAGAPAPRPAASAGLARAGRYVGTRYAVVLVWLAMAVIYASVEPQSFLRHGTFQAIFSGQQPLVFMAMALICTFSVSEFDLAVPSVFGLAATLVPVMNVLYHVNLVLAIVIAIAGAVAAEGVNAVLIVLIGVDPFVVTLGMSTLLVGVALALSRLTTVTGLPAGFAKVSQTDLLGLPLSFYYGVALVAIFAYVQTCTRLGRNMIFVGANREVARLAGVPVRRIRMGAYLTSGLISGIGGVIAVAGLGSYDPTSSATYLLPVFASGLLGTAIVIPGRFNAIGSFIAVYFLETGVIGLDLLGFSGWITDVFFGAALIIAVAVSTIVRRRGTGTMSLPRAAGFQR